MHYRQAFQVIEGTCSSACFFAVYSGHAPIAYKHTSLCGLLLLHINQHGTLMLLTSHSPTSREYLKTKILFPIKKTTVSLEPWENHNFQTEEAILSEFQSAFNFATTSNLRCNTVILY